MDVSNTFPVTSAMMATVNDMFNSAVTVAVPVGVGILALMIGIRAIPKIIKAFRG